MLPLAVPSHFRQSQPINLSIKGTTALSGSLCAFFGEGVGCRVIRIDSVFLLVGAGQEEIQDECFGGVAKIWAIYMGDESAEDRVVEGEMGSLVITKN
jgi:hypothetical protein